MERLTHEGPKLFQTFFCCMFVAPNLPLIHAAVWNVESWTGGKPKMRRTVGLKSARNIGKTIETKILNDWNCDWINIHWEKKSLQCATEASNIWGGRIHCHRLFTLILECFNVWKKYTQPNTNRVRVLTLKCKQSGRFADWSSHINLTQTLEQIVGVLILHLCH